MLALGVWQLERREWKEALIARYERAGTMSSAAVWPRSLEERERALFRHTQVLCGRVLSQGAIAGRNLAGETGWAQTARCALDGGGEALGVVAPGAGDAVRLIAAPPLAGLAPLARPDPRDVPNNHLAYAVQWFLFAAIAAVIYALALRKRLAAGDPRS